MATLGRFPSDLDGHNPAAVDNGVDGDKSGCFTAAPRPLSEERAILGSYLKFTRKITQLSMYRDNRTGCAANGRCVPSF